MQRAVAPHQPASQSSSVKENEFNLDEPVHSENVLTEEAPLVPLVKKKSKCEPVICVKEYRCAISGTSGSSGFASVKRELSERSTFEMVRAGDHCLSKISRQIEPLELIFG